MLILFDRLTQSVLLIFPPSTQIVILHMYEFCRGLMISILKVWLMFLTVFKSYYEV